MGYCRTCAELQSVKDQLSDELIRFKTKAEELEVKIEEINDLWISKNASTEQERQILEQKATLRSQEIKKLEDQLNKLREEDRMKDIFLKERDNNLKEKSAQIMRKEELIQEQEDIIQKREEDMQALFDQISIREKTIKELTDAVRAKEQRIKEKEEEMRQLTNSIDEKNEELHYMEEEMQEAVMKRKESETTIAELKDKIEESLKNDKTEMEMENQRLNSDVENLMGNIAELHADKETLQNELDKAKQALSEAMIMWERDRSSIGTQLNIMNEKCQLFEATSKKKDPEAIQILRKEVHAIIESREKLGHELRLQKMEHDNTVRILKTEKFKLTEELTSKIRMLAHEMTNNDKMSDELKTLRGQDEINYQLHHHEKILRAEYMAMKVRYETQLDRLQKEHIQLLQVLERLQREKNLDQEIIVGIQKGMSNIKETYSQDVTRWKDERTVLTSHISKIEEGKELADQLRAQIDALKQQLTDQEVERTDLINKMTTERRKWDVEKAQLTSKINQLDEQMGVFIQNQSKCKDTQFRMEVAWEKERTEHTRLMDEAQRLAVELQDQLMKRDEEHARERKNLLEQVERHRRHLDEERRHGEKVSLERDTDGTKLKHLERQIEELKEKQKKEQDIWMKEKGDLLRRLAEMRKVHLRDRRRIDDVLAALKRLRELATIVIESENSATLPSNGNDAIGTSGDASAASASTTPTPGGDMEDLKQNIDQVILKYVKESLRQIHFVAEELSKPPAEQTKEEKQVLRRSLSSSEIELLRDEFLLGPNEEVKKHSQDENDVNGNNVDPDYIENILMEQSSYYSDEKDARIEVHRVKTTKDITRVETKITSLPKPPPSFIIPRSRSTSPAPPAKPKTNRPVLKHISLDSHTNRLSAGVSSKGSSTDSSPVGTYSSTSIPPVFHFDPSLLKSRAPQSGSLDRLSPQSARRKFFETNPATSDPFLSWPERRKKDLNPNRNSRNFTGSTEVFSENGGGETVKKLRNSVSMDEGVGIIPEPCLEDQSSRAHSADSRSSVGKSHSSLRDVFAAMRKKLRPKIKRSQSAREPEGGPHLHSVKEVDKPEAGTSKQSDVSRKSEVGTSQSESTTTKPKVGPAKPERATKPAVGTRTEITRKITDDRHVTQDQLTPIAIPDDKKTEGQDNQKQEKESPRKGKSRSPSKRSTSNKEESSSAPSTLERIKRRFRSKSADRSREHHGGQVKPILVGHTTESKPEDPNFHYSETGV